MKFCNLILEMAFNQSDSIARIEVQISPLIQHIVKCWAAPQSQDYKHWKNEIAGILDKIDDFGNIKTKKGRISAKVLRKEYKWYQTENTLLKKIKHIEIVYDIKISDSDKQIYIKKLQNFLNELWDKLENDKIEVSDILTELSIF